MPKVSDLFLLEYGHSLELNRLSPSSSSKAVNFVGRAARNNGVTSRVAPIRGIAPAPANTLSVALGGQGGAGVAFLQSAPYYCGRDVMILNPRTEMSKKELLWWATCITANRFRFGFGRQANRTLKDLRLPDPAHIPSWVDQVDFRAPIISALEKIKNISRNAPRASKGVIGAARSRVEDVFQVTYGNSLELNRMRPDPKGVNFVARTAKNNGVVSRVTCPADCIPVIGGCLSVAVGGSVLETFVQKDEFVTGFHVMVLRPREEMCFEEMMFYAACLRANQWRYSYGRQANRTLRDLQIPSRGAAPSWAYGSFVTVADQLISKLAP